MDIDSYQKHIDLFHKVQNLSLAGKNKQAADILLYDYLSKITSIQKVDTSWSYYVTSTYSYLKGDILTLFKYAPLCGPNVDVTFRLLNGLIARGYPKYDEDYFIL